MVTVVTGAAADVTGLLLATALAIGGFYVIPRKRRQAKGDFQRRIDELRTHLKDVLTRQVHLELEQSGTRINEAHRALPPVRADPAAAAQRGAGRAGGHRGCPAPAPERASTGASRPRS